MSDEEDRQRHSAGATVRHRSPFADLEVPVRPVNPDRAFITKWVLPFYLENLTDECTTFVSSLRRVAPDLTEDVVAELLATFNWRPRIVGAWFVAIRRFTSFEEQIGRLLLRSDVCYAGRGYCLALARLNSPRSVAFVEEYLAYYLGRPDLWFDQGSAMAALGYLDTQNGTSRRTAFEDRWRRFIHDKPAWNLERDDELFRAQMQTIEAAANGCAFGPLR